MSDIATSSQRTFWFINRNFALLWLGQSISSIGDFFFTTTLALWVATQLARSQSWAPLAVSAVAIAGVIPLLVVGPIAGVFVDRWDKRQAMLRMDALRAIIVALLLLLIMFTSIVKNHSTNTWFLIAIYTTIALVSVCSQFFNPSRFALIGNIVPEGQRTRAMSFTSISFNLSLIIGPSLAAPLYFAFGVQWAMGINVLSFVISFLAIMAVQVPETMSGKKVRENKKFLHEFIEGLHFFRGNKLLVVLLIAGILFQFGAGPSNALYVLFGIQNLHTPKNLLGLFEANYGIGVIIGLLAAIYIAKWIGEVRVFWLSFLVWGSCMVIFGRTTNFVAGFALFFLLGFANAGINVVVGPLMLKATPRDFVGRVQSVNTPLIIGSSLLATTLAGFLASTVLNGFHASFLGSPFGTLDTIFSLSGFVVMGAGIYTVVALRKGITEVQNEEVVGKEV